MFDVVVLFPDQLNGNDKTHVKGQTAKASKKVHRPFLEFGYKADAQQIQKTKNKSFKAKFCNAILPGPVLNLQLAYFSKSIFLRNHRNIAVHFAI